MAEERGRRPRGTASNPRDRLRYHIRRAIERILTALAMIRQYEPYVALERMGAASTSLTVAARYAREAGLRGVMDRLYEEQGRLGSLYDDLEEAIYQGYERGLTVDPQVMTAIAQELDRMIDRLITLYVEIERGGGGAQS